MDERNTTQHCPTYQDLFAIWTQ